jgi:long-chain fatty acid transport protein
MLAAIAVLLAPAAEATNGYFTHGYGTSNKGLAGAGVAFPQDALTVATNPAGLAFLGKRYDAGLAVFNPNRHYTVSGNPSTFPGTFGLVPGTVESGSRVFFIPHFAASWEINSSSSWGFALYGHGGMNTDYPTNTFFGTSPTGVDFSQLFVVPTYAFKLGGGNHALGITAILAYQRFEIRGVQAFGMFSSNPGALSNNGHDSATGIGFKVGYLSKFSPRFSFGASYQFKIRMSEFDDYAGLFAEQGDFDVHPTWTAGIAIHATDRVTFVFDVQETMYSDTNSVGNPMLPNLFTAPLGADNGPGFGWQDMTTYKAGVQIAGANGWTWRFGASTGDQPIPETEVLFNILAPGVMEEHFTVGFTKELRSGRKVNFALMHAPSVTVSGPNPLEVPGFQTIDLEMDQWEVELGYSWGF